MAIICHNCKGNGFLRLAFEAEESIEQCKVCHSQGELDESKHYHQTWSGGVSNEPDNFYWGPPLDPEGFTQTMRASAMLSGCNPSFSPFFKCCFKCGWLCGFDPSTAKERI